MKYTNLEISQPTIYAEIGDTAADLLTIHEQGDLQTIEGKTITLTAGGIERSICPGKYIDAVISVREDFHSAVLNHLGEYGFRTGLYIESGKINSDRSVESAVIGGEYNADSLKNVMIYSENEGFNGLVLADVGKFSIDNLKIRANGHGRSDFSGRGSGILITGKSDVEINNYDFVSDGVVRNAITVADGVRLHVKNSRIIAYSGTDQECNALEKSRKAAHMISVPWVLGLWGNNRATNVIGTADVIYEDSKVCSESWGVLSVDGLDDPEEFGQFKVNLTAKNCDLEIFGKSGYITYAIHSTKNVIDHCRIKTPDYAMIISNEYSSADVINGTEIDSKRFAFMWHQNQGGNFVLKDSIIKTKMAPFLIKACYPNIYVENTIIKSENNIILELIDLDDPGLGANSVKVDSTIAVKDTTHDVCGFNYATANLSGFIKENYMTDTKAVFKDMTIEGDFYNSTTNACKVGIIYPDDFELPSGPPPEDLPMEDGDRKGFLDMFPPSTVAPVNLILEFHNVKLTGIVSSSTAKHNVSEITADLWYELGMVHHTPCAAVNNGVIMTLAEGSRWTVTGVSYLTSLTISPDSIIENAKGEPPRLKIDGVEHNLTPGDYKGNIVIMP